MSDLVKTILKWILVIILTIVVVLLVINIANRNSKKKAKNQPVQAIEQIKLEDTEEDIQTSDDTENTLMVNLGDTASNRGMTFWIGLFLLGTTSYYVYKNKQVNE